MVNLSASLASFGKVPPKVTPGSVVLTSPVMLRISGGAVIFGSKNSMCDGPPCRNSSTTARSLTSRRRFRRRGAGGEQLRQDKTAAEQAEAADLEEFTSGGTLAGVVVTTVENGEHGGSPEQVGFDLSTFRRLGDRSPR